MSEKDEYQIREELTQCSIEIIKKDGKWLMTKAVASTY